MICDQEHVAFVLKTVVLGLATTYYLVYAITTIALLLSEWYKNKYRIIIAFLNNNKLQEQSDAIHAEALTRF